MLAYAQAPPPPPDPAQLDAPLHTLRVYMDLIQVPVLVLDSEHDRMKPIDPSKFQVSLDAGPNFRPRNVRQEGDDPIALAILLDPNSQPEMMPKAAEAISGLANGPLHPEDRVTIYGLDCNLIRTVRAAPPDAAALQAGVERAIAKWTEHRKDKHAVAPCPKRINLWDAMSYAIQDLSQRPGRRVLLVIANGEDHGSTVKWNDLRSFSQTSGVAVFGYSLTTSGMIVGRLNPSGGRPTRAGIAGSATTSDLRSSEDPFNSICELSGGMTFNSGPSAMPKRLVDLIAIIRDRYIVEFARARNDSPGEHGILVTVSNHPSAYIRPAGVTIMMRDPDAENDPNTIPRDTTDAPELGKRKPIKPSH